MVNSKHNARLIAAAPELLNILKRLSEKAKGQKTSPKQGQLSCRRLGRIVSTTK